MKGLIVAGIGTEVGKSVASAVLCEALGWSYWKPLASGLNDAPAESVTVGNLLSGAEGRVFPERYLFGASLSPHIAAAMEGVTISLEELRLPDTENPLVVELAGGVMVPLSDTATNLDLIRHTLLTLEILKSRDVPIYGVLFNGEELPDTERVIEQLSGVRILGRIPTLPQVTRESVGSVAASFRGRL